jgi:hypothetical protein
MLYLLDTNDFANTAAHRGITSERCAWALMVPGTGTTRVMCAAPWVSMKLVSRVGASAPVVG